MKLPFTHRPNARAYAIAASLLALFMLVKALGLTPSIARLSAHSMSKVVEPLTLEDWTCTNPACEATATLNDENLWRSPNIAGLLQMYVLGTDGFLLLSLLVLLGLSLTSPPTGPGRGPGL